jgi:DNA-binding transcriptional MerR regulator
MAEPASIKAPDAFRTISEVAEELELPQHVLRFWETRFTQIKPMKRGGGRRYYRPEDVDLLRGVRLLLYGEGFTIRGVQRLLKDKGVGFIVAVGQTGSVQTVTTADDRDDEEDAAPPRPQQRREPIIEAPEVLAPTPPSPAAAMPGQQPAPVPPPPRPALAEGKRRHIEAALSELLEAKRLLEGVR